MPPSLPIRAPEVPPPERHLGLGPRDEDPPLETRHLDPPRAYGGVPPHRGDLLHPSLVARVEPPLRLGALLGPRQPALEEGLVYPFDDLELKLPLVAKSHIPPRVPPLALFNVHLPCLVVLALHHPKPVLDRLALPLVLLLRRLVERLPLLDIVLQQQLRPAPRHYTYRLLVQLLAHHTLDQLLPPPLLLRLQLHPVAHPHVPLHVALRDLLAPLQGVDGLAPPLDVYLQQPPLQPHGHKVCALALIHPRRHHPPAQLRPQQHAPPPARHLPLSHQRLELGVDLPPVHQPPVEKVCHPMTLPLPPRPHRRHPRHVPLPADVPPGNLGDARRRLVLARRRTHEDEVEVLQRAIDIVHRSNNRVGCLLRPPLRRGLPRGRLVHRRLVACPARRGRRCDGADEANGR
mmetsp:Transcript_60809/g.146342  ORF Transcript_60809/g.146342 Transcript_60809/m.146342 type:complete len:404 (+) Transcript_60809:483-1694(+)